MPDKKDSDRRTTERRPPDIDTLPSPTADVDSLAATLLSDKQGEHRAVAPPPPETVFDAASRYALRRVLGAGGMGEVRLCADAWIGRDVAMKVVKPSSGGSASETRGRFLREACVQGQLEHPSVVPVYDIGRTPDGETFFTMKRIGGHTLEEIVDGLREGAAAIAADYTRRKLLSAMSQVCLAVAYAHSRGVVHRDLKPANVMLGDFGEVYVLDWGVAKVAGSSEAAPTASPVTITGGGPLTQAGSLVGTPGYMAPEQVRGEPVTPATDVYALGLMLFEVLALDRAHGGATIEALLASSLCRVCAPSERAGAAGIPPELDAICQRATALDPAERYASARAMHQAIEAFLDGERDAERRGDLVRAHLAAARAALARAADGGPEAEQHRAEGIRELGRAVALDPSDEGALRTISEIVLAPPERLPPEARAELKAVELRDRAAAAHRMAAMYAAWLALVPMVLWMGVENRPALAGLIVLVIAAAAYMTWVGSSPERARPRYARVAFGLNFLLVAWSATIFGPFVFTPGIATSSAAGFVISLRANRITRRALAVLSVAAVFVPTLLQWAGVLPPSYSFEHGVIVIHPLIADFPPALTRFAWTAVTLAQLVLPALLIGRAAEALVTAEERNFAQAWRLRQLLPAAPAK
ncbi:MAG TPA: serine/threonine-protein kinase [Polyangiaceae bacterium]|nr:serine/threonine-protein kinase [Polyangiaceae bacterium]